MKFFTFVFVGLFLAVLQSHGQDNCTNFRKTATQATVAGGRDTLLAAGKRVMILEPSRLRKGFGLVISDPGYTLVSFTFSFDYAGDIIEVADPKHTSLFQDKIEQSTFVIIDNIVAKKEGICYKLPKIMYENPAKYRGR